MKRSITVLGIESDGIRGVRLEEVGPDWNCVDSQFWSINGARNGDGENPPDEGDSPVGAAELSDEERYLAIVDIFRKAAKHFGTYEIVLSVPLSSLLIKVVRTSVEDRDHLHSTANSELVKVSPFPDETPVTGIETVAETDTQLLTIFAALPEAAAAEIGDALDEAQVRVVRTDITAIGWLRNLWPRIMGAQSRSSEEDGPKQSFERIVVLMDLNDGWDIVVLDEGAPVLLRGLGGVGDVSHLVREVTLSLIQAGANKEIGEIVLFSGKVVPEEIVEKLNAFAPVRLENVEAADANWGIDGVARRMAEGATLDVTPADWTEYREETRFKKKLKLFASCAGAAWVLLMAVFFGGPVVYDHLTERQKKICKLHAPAYKEVKEMQDKVKLVRQYSDHARGTLEIFKAVSDRMPAGITLTSFNYRKEDKLTLIGEADLPTAVYDFKNALSQASFAAEEEDSGASGGSAEEESENGEKLFSEVILSGPSKSRNVHRFTIECVLSSAEGDEK
ncbi:MAG: PilN domain-containing protein [Kiritimatiellae bacterium]|nr:PilN domain-containing protein [Kiritimatiellia bacterium]